MRPLARFNLRLRSNVIYHAPGEEEKKFTLDFPEHSLRLEALNAACGVVLGDAAAQVVVADPAGAAGEGGRACSK